MKTLVVASVLVLAPLVALAGNDGRGSDGSGSRGDMFKKLDANGDGVITREEAQSVSADKMAKRFDTLDLNKDGQITQEELQQSREQHRLAMKEKFAADFKAADKNGDSGLSKEEATAGMPRLAKHFDAIDANKDGVVTQEELQAHHEQMRGKHHRPAPSQG